MSGQFQKPKLGNATNLDFGTVQLEGILELLFDFRHVLSVIHVDKIDDNQSPQIPQAQLPANLFCGLNVGLESGGFHILFPGGTSRIDINGDQRLCRINHQRATGTQRNLPFVHGFNLVFYLVTGKNGQGILVGLHDLDIAWHKQTHEVLADAIPVLAFNQDFLHIRGIKITNGTNDKIALFVDQGRRF